MLRLIKLPIFPPWLQQIAGLLPLSLLIEFIDIPMRLHLLQLTSSVPLWNWPVTPAGARLLLTVDGDEGGCHLDKAQRCTPLYCIDAKWGDHYPSSAATTVRLCIAGNIPTSGEHGNPSSNVSSSRPQILELICFRPRAVTIKRKSRFPYWPQKLVQRFSEGRSCMCAVVASGGWILWFTACTMSFLSRAYVAAAYLLTILVTGLTVSMLWGGSPRKLSHAHHSPSQRLVLVTSSLNATKWHAFLGPSAIVNSLLNRDLSRDKEEIVGPFLRTLLAALILAQWMLAVSSCALQNWDALVISFWIVFCAWSSAYAQPPKAIVRDWLRQSCELDIECIQANFSSRRAMLSALVCLNPDHDDSHIKWIDPILAPSPERTSWLQALSTYIASGMCEEEEVKSQYWWKFITEGVEVGKRIEGVMRPWTTAPV